MADQRLPDDRPCLDITIHVYNLYGVEIEDAETLARDALDDLRFELFRLMPRDEEDEAPDYEVMDSSVNVGVIS